MCLLVGIAGVFEGMAWYDAYVKRLSCEEGLA